MSELPEKIVRFDVARVEYGLAKLCKCSNPHYEVDYQNRLVRCLDCGAIVDPLEAIMEIAKYYKRIEKWMEDLLEQRRQIDSYKPRRVVLKELEKRYCQSERDGLEPTCPECGAPFPLESLLHTSWCNPTFIKRADGK